MGAAKVITSFISSSMSPALLPVFVFIICAILSFATGTSWGTFAIAMPLALSIAFNATCGQATLLTTLCFAAVAGGGLFGDHVRTQLPYAVTVAIISAALYLILGFVAV